MDKEKINFTIAFLCCVFCYCIGTLFNSFSVDFFSVILTWCVIVYFCVRNFCKNASLFVFCSTFFVFIIGRLLFEVFDIDYIINDENSLTALTIVYISLIFTTLAYICLSDCHRVLSMKFPVDTVLLRSISLKIFKFSYLFSIAVILEKVVFVQAFGYTEYYVEYNTILPDFFSKIATIGELAFILYLSTNPDKQELLKYIALFILLGVLALGYGQRNPLCLKLLLIFAIYYPARNNGDQKWISKKFKYCILLLIPIGIVFLSFWGMYRSGLDYRFSGIDIFKQFFFDQSQSWNIIKNVVKYEFRQDAFFIFEPVMAFFRNNFIFNLFNGRSALYSNGDEYLAIYGNNFDLSYAYFLRPDLFYKGIRWGSCYLAESFHDFGYVGIVIISIIYGFVLSLGRVYRQINIFGRFLYLLMIYRIIYSPRDYALNFIAPLFSFTFIVFLVVVYIMYRRGKGGKFSAHC